MYEITGRIGDSGKNRPLVSIGMPVYNAEKLIRRALDSLLAQDYENIEIIISDNNSTDATQGICREYEIKDKRIKYYWNERNIGSIQNFNRVFELSNGKYFMWHAHDDLREPNYITSCLRFMEINPSVILCCTNTLLEEGGDLRHLQENFSTIGMPLNNRFRKILWNNSCASIYGLMQSRILKKTGLLRSVFGPDNLLLAELSLMGEFFQIPLALFKISIRKGSILKKVKAVFETILPKNPRSSFFPFTKLGVEHWKLVQKSHLKRGEKLVAFLDIILCFLLKYKILISDPFFTLYLNLSRRN